MQQIINFLIRNKNLLLYLLLVAFALGFTIQSHSYHKSKFIKSANWLSGGIYGTVANIHDYFDLKEENEKLFEENKQLRKLLFNKIDTIATSIKIDSTSALFNYIIIPGKVANNSFSSSKNYLTINRGKKHGVSQDMGVISSRGIVGIIEGTSANFSTVQSVLNTLSNINAKLKKTNHFGTLTWDTKNINIVQLVDIPRLVPIAVGDTIVTGGMSSIFPEEIPIGSIVDYKLDDAKNYYTINVALFNDMTNLDHVYLIRNELKKEKDSLESATFNE